ncbi:MAG: V-type ATP synthase subunit C [candidate division WS2 bacterium]|nr:V-type ATP synthase subunit C [Candidatus Lithacetigena glycinireducens]
MIYYLPNQLLQDKPVKSTGLYSFPVGVVKGLESKLLKPRDFKKIADEPLASVIPFLKNYFPLLEDSISITSINRFVLGSRKSLYQLLYKILPEQFLINLFFLPDDFHNLKVELKRLIFNVNTEKLYHQGMGMLKNGILTLDSPVELKTAFTKSYEIYRETNNLQQAEIVLDREYLLLSLKLARNSNSKVITSYYEKYVYLQDLLTILRGKKWELPLTIVESGLASTGYLGKQLKDIWSGKVSVINALRKYGVKEDLKDGLLHITEVEKYISMHLWDFIYSYRFKVDLNMETVFVYLKLWENQLNIVKSILLGKTIDLSADKIKGLGSYEGRKIYYIR